MDEDSRARYGQARPRGYRRGAARQRYGHPGTELAPSNGRIVVSTAPILSALAVAG